MSTITTSYTVLKYRHDAAAAEVLNFGVVLYSPGTGQVGVLISTRYGRLSEAFAGFDGDLYHAVTARLETALDRIGSRLSEGLFQVVEREQYRDALAIVREAWPDQGLAYFAGPPLFGVTDDFERELKDIYDRFVLGQSDQRDWSERMDDAALWSEIRKVLTPRGITSVLSGVVLGEAEVEFDHAYKNHTWHVLEPVSFDYANPQAIKQRALITVGKAAAVRSDDRVGSFTVIVGKPRRIQAEKAYRDAMRLLRDLPILNSRVVEEDDAERFADQLEAEMRQHGVLPENQAAADLTSNA